MKIRSALIGSFLLAAALRVPAWSQAGRMARPGSINYVEGQASIGTQALAENSAGTAELGAGQTLTTQNGKVEILLTPGVFLRVDNNSAVKMVSPDLANTEVAVDRGRAMVEIMDIHKENNIRVDEDGVSTKLDAKGIYDFDAATNQVRVFKGKAEVFAAHKLTLTDGRETTLSPGASKLHAQKFDQKNDEDAFYRWCGLRSGYLSEANVYEASLYVNGGPGWYGPGWYWDPAFGAYTFLPGDGIFYSPYGWGFYSPFAIWGTPFFYGGGFYGPHRFNEFHAPYGHGVVVPRGGFGGGFHGGFRGGGRR